MIIQFTSPSIRKKVSVTNEEHITGEDFKRMESIFKKVKPTDEEWKYLCRMDEHLKVCKSCRTKYKNFLIAIGRWF